MPNTPSTDEMDGSDTLLNRRSSSGGLLSPEVDMPNVPRCSIDGPEHDGFYLLKKDSQRRLTLSRVLEQDSEKICSKWMLSIHQDFGTTVLTMNHLEMLRCALKEYIMDQNRSVIEQAIITLKEELDFDSNAINELHSAIYMFQEAVNAVLRMHSIKPHWMFALDNLVRNAVQAAITVLSPELGANLAGQEGRRSGVAAADTSPSALSSTNSARDTHALHALRHENHKLLQELIESYQLNQTLLRQVLEEQKSQMMIFKEFVEKKSRSCTPEVFVSQSDSAVDTGDGSDCVDEGEALRLREWVAARGLPSAVTNALLSHCYVLTDLLQHAQREDIAKLNLKGGIELRLWRAIQEHRLHNSPPPLRRSSSTGTDDDGPLLLVEGRARPRRAVSTASACSSNPTIVIRDQVNGDDSVAPYYGDGLNL